MIKKILKACVFGVVGGVVVELAGTVQGLLPYFSLEHIGFEIVFFGVGMIATITALTTKQPTITEMLVRTVSMIATCVIVFLLGIVSGIAPMIYQEVSLTVGPGADNASGMLLILYYTWIAVVVVLTVMCYAVRTLLSKANKNAKGNKTV